MKNIIKIEIVNSCNYCKKVGFFCETPQGADYTTCPLCSNLSDLESDSELECDEESEICNIPYCKHCKILYDIGCTHAENGCTDNIYNGHLIGEWIDKRTNEKYKGMPQFDDIKDYKENVKNIEIIKYVCPNNGVHCTKGIYPKSKHPEHYKECYLMKKLN